MKKLLVLGGAAALIASLLVIATVAPADAARRHHRGHRHGGGGHPSVTVSNADNGHAITLHNGQRLQVILAGALWTFDAGTDTTVLARQGDSQFRRSKHPRPGCPYLVDSGCGTTLQRYVADSPGTSTVTATHNCGAAALCLPEQTQWTVEVTVLPDAVILPV